MQWMAKAQVMATHSVDGSDLLAPIEKLAANQLVLRDRALFAEGDEARYAYRILSGVVRTYKMTADGRRHVTDFLMAGDLLGFEPGTHHIVAAEAVTDCVVRHYPRRQIELSANDDPGLSRRLLVLAYARLATAQSQLVALGRKTAEERLASFLLALVDRADRAGRAVALPMGRGDIADHLGLTIETVSRLFSRLRKEQVIDFPDAHSFVVTDRTALEGRSALQEAA